MAWKLRFTFVGLDGAKRTRAMDLKATDYAAASAAVATLQAAWNSVSDAHISEAALAEVTTYTGAPAGNTHQKALVNLYLDANGNKTAPYYIPAPVDGIFTAPSGELYNVVDITDTALIQFVQDLEALVEISDNEAIVTTLTNGIKNGRRVFGQ